MTTHSYSLVCDQVHVVITKPEHLSHELVPGIVVYENGNYVYSMICFYPCSACGRATQGMYVEDGGTFCVECLIEDTNIDYESDAECGVQCFHAHGIKFLSVIHISDFIRRVYEPYIPTQFCLCCKVTAATGCCVECNKYVCGLVRLWFNIAQACSCIPDEVVSIIRSLAISQMYT